MEHMFGKPVQPFYRISCGLWGVIGRRVRKSAYFRRLEERFDILYPNYKKEDIAREYICYKCSITIMILTAALFFGLVFFAKGEQRTAVDTIQREEYWGQEKEEVLQMETDGLAQEVAIQVPQRQYKEADIAKVLEKMGSSLEKAILRNNVSLDEIKTDLDLVSEVPDTSVEVVWEMDTEDYIAYDGTLIPGAVTEAGAVVNLTATLTYGSQSCMHSFAVRLQKPDLSPQEELRQQLTKEIELRNVSSAAASVLVLPDSLGNSRVSFYKEENSFGGKLAGILSVLAVLMFFLKDEDIKKELEERKKQMLVDYSEIVSKLTLLLGAGMTIRSALDKIAFDYDKKKREGTQPRRYAYDEIVYVCREMQGGVSERLGIDMLGKRCHVPCYMKLCSLLLQNLKKGSKGMAQSLSYEVGQAFDERKNLAKKLGEEAGTKLLFPMILMLVIVMVVLIVPALMSF